MIPHKAGTILQILLVLTVIATICTVGKADTTDEAACQPDKALLREVVLVKIGGSSLTDKAQLETLNTTALEWLVETIKKSISLKYSKPDNNEQDCKSTHNNQCPLINTQSTPAIILIHGAGSFGHYHARQYGFKGVSLPISVTNTTDNDPVRNNRNMFGLAQTRQSVTKLNHILVTSLVNAGISAVGISPCVVLTRQMLNNNDTSGLVDIVSDMLRAGLLPVLHGDGCLTGRGSVGILSGDILMEILANQVVNITRAVFLTDVAGVYTRDPRLDADAELLSELPVHNGRLVQGDALEATGSSHEHDVTGGLQTKLASAISIAVNGINVSIVQTGTTSAQQAIQGETMERGSLIFSIKR
jgi:isopentenyl phosphate kinase